jgi:hypothetical protein
MIYDFKCSVCGAIQVDVVLSIHHTDEDHPKCCFGEPMADYHTQAPYVAWEDQQLLDGGFKANHDGTVITSHRQNREYMKKHGLENAMDVYEKPTYESEQQERAEAQAAIDQITPDEQALHQLKSDGVIDSDGNLIQ